MEVKSIPPLLVFLPTTNKEVIVAGVKQTVKEIKLVKAGKLKARDARELIKET